MVAGSSPAGGASFFLILKLIKGFRSSLKQRSFRARLGLLSALAWFGDRARITRHDADSFCNLMRN